MPTMRAKMQVQFVTRHSQSEQLQMIAVPKSSAYPEDGADEDNTYARWSPQGQLSLTVANPALFGKFNPGDKFYVDFTPADA